MEQNRLRSWVVWTSIVAQIISLGQITGLWASLGVDAGMIGDVAAGVLQMLVIFGILNNPTKPDGF